MVTCDIEILNNLHMDFSMFKKMKHHYKTQAFSNFHKIIYKCFIFSAYKI